VLTGAAVVRLSRPGARTGPLLVAGIVVGPVTIPAIPALGHWGAQPDNMTLLDRHYVLGRFLIVGVTAVVTLVVVVARGRQRP
jgi:hypothetical protein